MTHKSMVVAPQPEAAEVGIEILKAGGNAIDAAIAVAFAQGVIDPQMCGLSGYGTMVIHLPQNNEQVSVDFHSRAPAAATSTMWERLFEVQSQDGFGFKLKGRVNELGYGAIGVPAAVRGYEMAHSRYGKMLWKEIIQPAIEIARAGWMIRPAVFRFWSEDEEHPGERLHVSEEGRRLYCRPDGSTKRIGEKIVNADYASTLEAIARDGADAFYLGDIAKTMIADISAHGGLLSYEDLASYRACVSRPVRAKYRDYEVVSVPPPASGLMLLQMLKAIENYDLGGLGHNSPHYIRIVSEIMKRATIDKEALIGDPAVFPDPAAELADPKKIKRWADEIDRGERQNVTRSAGDSEAKHTTHITVVDSDANCVALTHTLAMPSGVVTPGLGFMHNGTMGAFDPRPNRPGSIAPGRMRISSLCPSIVFESGKPRMVVGAPGGPQIPMGVLQTVLNVLDFGMAIDRAVAAPRFSATSNAIDLSNRIPRSVARTLSDMGYDVKYRPFNYTFSWVHALEFTSGGLVGGADPGQDGVAYGF